MADFGIFNSDFIKHVEELRYRVIRIIYFLGFFFLIFFMFRIDFFTIMGSRVPLLYPDPYQNLGSQFLYAIESHVLPAGTSLIIIKPTDGVVADMYSCIFLSFMFSTPAIAYHLWRFVSPGLKRSEAKTIKSIVVPATLLFLAGAFVGLWFIAPELFRIFNSFDIGLGAVSSVSVLSFISFIFIYILAFGVSFEVPVFMVGLTKFGLVESGFWEKNWRYAVVISFIFGMIFSPGVTGFTMVVIALPMIALYFAGIFFARRAESANVKSAKSAVSESL
ncbi:MAG: twin-arginine translocase subunit TatC [Thermoplasmataceae archaeon]|jgi:sec-independent protein translocase protein TatC